MRDAGVVAVLRAPSAGVAVSAVDALVAGGVTGIEITFSTPDAPAAIREVARRYGDAVVLGAGTVRSEVQAQEAAEAGAQFLVCPGTDESLASAMIATGAAVCLGALTPSEVMTAARLGAHVVKVFPASVGGPSYLKALRAPFPDVAMMPTGGVNAGNVAQWLDAGAVAVGAGGELCPLDAMVAGRWDEIEAQARRFAAAYDAARAAA
ncbi:bifunctional 4-hydroxy-2-oxoglutarate aldolase/2-dehydro-3-deoxy-phosphogluconate aldolase [Nocardioides sp. SYSU D00065]|uniref:bifunctional 4-hydroxy-2-oxoglutarate aldolase/2-dehydro-3-deoxy-phosphogluconate aldolase n=1 Tax=Nocardioides sp. SYSU D00065 TaxID=2817378 RepID=UPI001FF01A8F|nr:bifunctional 4-hydroxy-2-oxoglutarate aldolase/2-dehydro-3-deoxy-phosphogluconate aldolase [Nocardioides sp. SYSU D00065]